MRSSILVVALAGGAVAQTIDGVNFAAEYGSALFVQTVGTSFGNNNDAGALNANGSEIDGVYARLDGGMLYVGVAGNLETNFNKLNLVLDFRDGGQNTLGFGSALGNLSGLTLDAGFDADVVLSYTNGNQPQANTGSGMFEHYLDGANVGVSEGFLGGGTRDGLGGTGAIVASLDGASITIDGNNSNTGGVGGFGSPNDSDPATVDTGIEMAIDLAALGYTGGIVKIAGWVNGSGNDFISNQVIGGIPDSIDFLRGPSGVNFAAIDGDQFVVIPTPAVAGAMGITALGAIRRRR